VPEAPELPEVVPDVELLVVLPEPEPLIEPPGEPLEPVVVPVVVVPLVVPVVVPVVVPIPDVVPEVVPVVRPVVVPVVRLPDVVPEVVPVVKLPEVVPEVVPVVKLPAVVAPEVVPLVVPVVVDDPLLVALPPPAPELPGLVWPPGAPFSQPLCLPGLFWRRSRPRLRNVSSEVDVPLLLVPLDPTELPVVVPVVAVLVVVEPPRSLELLPIELEPLEPWFAPLDDPMELLPELAPERLVPDEPEPMLLEPELPGDPDEPDEPDEPAL